MAPGLLVLNHQIQFQVHTLESLCCGSSENTQLNEASKERTSQAPSMKIEEPKVPSIHGEVLTKKLILVRLIYAPVFLVSYLNLYSLLNMEILDPQSAKIV
ncbi:hypothetical protein O6P43_000188 [Quillaja saponaria]|uniref:Uncharacterized protein n=1 Tax=Quillaja saponaria TaxID=32244 RepID=A0AAD7VM98_QUISA|nr:hypothetical protein O6P43_000188 [Quillaja saponaria]